MKYSVPSYQNFSIPREVLVYFISKRREYLLRTLYYVKHFCKPVGYGSDISYIDPDQIAEAFSVSKQTIKNHIQALTELGFLKPRKGFRFIYYVYGHKKAVDAVRMLQDTNRYTLGLGKNSEDKAYLKRLNSNYLSGYRFHTSILSLSKPEFRAAIQGAIYTHNVKRQAYQKAKKAGLRKSRVLNNGKAQTAVSGTVSCQLAGEMIGRSKMSGSRLRKQLDKLGHIYLEDRSKYIGSIPDIRALVGYREAYPDNILIPVPRRKDRGYMVLLVECSESLLPLPEDQLIQPCRINSKHKTRPYTRPDRMAVKTAGVSGLRSLLSFSLQSMVEEVPEVDKGYISLPFWESL